MRNAVIKGKWLAVLGVVLAATLLVTACAAPTPPSPGGNVVEIGGLPPLTGGGGSADQPCFGAFLDYLRYFNEKEGIPGVTLELVWRDSATAVDRTLSGYRVLADRGVPVLWSDLTIAYGALKEPLAKDQIPLVAGGAIATAIYPPGWIFDAWSTEGEAAVAVLDYFLKNWKGATPPKLQLSFPRLHSGKPPQRR